MKDEVAEGGLGTLEGGPMLLLMEGLKDTSFHSSACCPHEVIDFKRWLFSSILDLLPEHSLNSFYLIEECPK